MKKYLLIIPLFFLAAPSAIAYDFGAAGYIAAIGATAIGVAAFVGSAPALATLAIGAAVMGITFDRTESTGSPLVVQVSPSAQLATPEGWTPPAAGQSKPTPPAQKPAKLVYKVGQHEGETPTAACVAAWANVTNSPGWSYAYNTATHCYGSSPSSASYSVSAISQAFSCSAGYTLSGTTCLINNPDLVEKPSDGVCGITRVGNSFSTDAQDPDCATLPASTSVQPNSITQTKPDGSQKSVTINSDGSVTATDSRPDIATNTTQTNTTQLAAPNASGVSNVSGQGTGATNGIGSSNSGAPVPTFDKTGLATEGTLAGIKSDTGAIKDALTNSGNVDGSLSAEKSAFDSAADVLAGMFSSEGSTTSGIEDDFSFGGFMPAQCGCEPLSMTFRGHSASFDWCAPMETMKSAFAWLVGLLTAFYVLSLFRVGAN